MYSKFRYNFTITLLVAVIGIFLGAMPLLSIVSDALGSDANLGESVVDEQKQDSMPTEGFTVPSSTASVFTRLEHGFNVLKNGEGFSTEIIQKIVAMGQVQNVYSRSMRAGNLDYTEEWQYSNTPFAQNNFLSKYSDGTTYKSNIIKNKDKFSGEEKTFEQGYADEHIETSATDYFARVGNFNDFPLTINSSNLTSARYNKAKSEIFVTFNPQAVDQTYLQSFEDNGTKDVTFKEITILFTINKKTGFFTSIVKKEIFNTVYAGIPVSCTAEMTVNFLKVNTSMKAEIETKVAENFE